MTHHLALIVDDEPDIRELLQITLERMQVEAVPAGSLDDAYRALKQQRFDLCLADMRLPDGDGLDLVRHISTTHPNLPVAVITAHGNMETAIEALKAGAFDFVSKPVQLPILRRLVETALRLGQAPSAPTEQPTGSQWDLLGGSTAMEEIRHLIHKLARSQAPVYISGESGTGKELAARLIHDRSPRAAAAFVPVNCGAIPRDLIESELFGHVKGSFTGAVRDKAGLISVANGGTLFLDEVADLPLAMQVKLLRVIQEKTIRPVGATQEQRVDVRFISASHKDLEELVRDGAFRQDLYYRLNVIELPMPPLRERTSDIPELTDHILARLAKQYGRDKPKLAETARSALLSYPFPGNVRELENTLERAFTLFEGNCIEREDLGLRPDTADRAVSLEPDEDLDKFLARVEREVLQRTLEQHRWNRSQAARRLGLSPRALRYRMERLGMDISGDEEG